MSLNETVYQTHAAKYHELGFNPIPVLGKAPVVKQFPQFACWLMDEVERCQMEAVSSDDGGIGLVTGHGWYAVDVDTTDLRLMEILPYSPMTKIGSKGKTPFYRWSGVMPRGTKPRVKLGEKRYRIPVELLAIGQQTVVPPSPHPEGMIYEWAKGSELVRVEDLPEHDPVALMEMLKKFCVEKNILLEERVVDRVTVEGEHGVVLPLGKGNRNNFLTEAAYKMVCVMNIENKTRDDLVVDIMSLDKRSHPGCAWFEDKSEGRGESAKARAIAFIDRTIEAAERRGELYPKMVFDFSSDLEWATDDGAGGEIEDEGLRRQPVDADIELLMSDVPFLHLWRHYVVSNAPVYSPIMTLGAGVSVLSAMGANLYECRGQRSNLYVLNVAGSATGKDAPQTCARHLLHAVQQNCGLNIPSVEQYKSAAVIRVGFEKTDRHIKFDIQDEISYTFNKVGKEGSAVSGALDVLNKLFTASNKILKADEALSKVYQVGAIANPSLTLLASTTPTGLQGLMQSSHILGGIGGRLLYMFQEFDPVRLRDELFEPKEKMPPVTLVDLATKWFSKPVVHDSEPGVFHNTNIAQAEKLISAKPLPCDATFAPAVNAWIKACNDVRRVAVSNGHDIELDPFMTMLGRSVELVLRLCICWYVGNDGQRVCSSRTVEWATQIVKMSQWNAARYLAKSGTSHTSLVVDGIKATLVRGARNSHPKPYRMRRDAMTRKIESLFKKFDGRHPNKTEIENILNRLSDVGISYAAKHYFIEKG